MTRRKLVKKKPGRKPQWERPSADALVKDTLGWWVRQYVGWLRERNYSDGSSFN